uniref:TNFR-Cys domain-containing protein n=1 Tax=Meloidogyne enterolobii TaxID=390850 RepID=A0A6V7U694_MELEN|nr:unnamed protein product [Meloidogyne enterolobii]
MILLKILSKIILFLLIQQIIIIKSSSFNPSPYFIIETADEIKEDSLSASSSTSSSSSSDSFSEETSVEKEDEGEEEFPLENVADWQPPTVCPKGQFRSNGGNCKQCSVCGKYLFEKKPCQSDQDVQCEFCITGWKEFGNNRDFEIKCAQMINIRKIFHRQLSERKIQQQNQQQQANGDLWKKITMAFPSESTYLFRFVGINNSKESDNWWKLELAVKIGFYLSLITLILAIIRYVYKKKFSSSKRSLYHTVQVKSPPAMEEFQEKDIIRAAESIRQKLGKKDYERLQEEFI